MPLSDQQIERLNVSIPMPQMDFTDWLEYKYDKLIVDDYDYFQAKQNYVSWLDQATNLFFIGLNPRWNMFKFLPDNLNIMFSAAGFWNGYNWRKTKFPKKSGLKWLDCGGFTLLNQYGNYPFSVVNLANLIAQLKPHYYATMDYPCEPEISRSLGLKSNWDRIKATVENAIRLIEYENQLPGQVVPVIQGYTLEEYQFSIDCHQQAGTIREYMAIGSMCRRIKTQGLNELIIGIYESARQAGVKRLHYFGLKLSPNLDHLRKYIWSSDSAVAMYTYDPEIRKQHGGRLWPRGQTEKKVVFMDFLKRLDNLGLQYQLG